MKHTFLFIVLFAFSLTTLVFPLSIFSDTKVDPGHAWESVVDGFIWKKRIEYHGIEIDVVLEKVVVRRSGNIKKTFRFNQKVACLGSDAFDTTVWLIGHDTGTRTSCGGVVYPFSIPQFFEKELKPFPKEVEKTPPLKKRDKPGLQI